MHAWRITGLTEWVRRVSHLSREVIGWGGVPEPETTLGSKALSLGKGFVISETANLNEQYVGISKLCGSVWGSDQRNGTKCRTTRKVMKPRPQQPKAKISAAHHA